MLCFADFELDQGTYQLRRDGQVVLLERIPLELLFLLTEPRGQPVTRDEVVERIWKGVFLGSATSINVAVRKIRQALGDDAKAPRFVISIPAKGYRFIADVCEEPPAASNSWQAGILAIGPDESPPSSRRRNRALNKNSHRRLPLPQRTPGPGTVHRPHRRDGRIARRNRRRYRQAGFTGDGGWRARDRAAAKFFTSDHL